MQNYSKDPHIQKIINSLAARQQYSKFKLTYREAVKAATFGALRTGKVFKILGHPHESDHLVFDTYPVEEWNVCGTIDVFVFPDGLITPTESTIYTR